MTTTFSNKRRIIKHYHLKVPKRTIVIKCSPNNLTERIIHVSQVPRILEIQ